MNWRRGVLLAGLNLAAALTMIVVLDVREIRENKSQNTIPDAGVVLRQAGPDNPLSAKLVRVQDASGTGTVTFDPCAGFIDGYSAQEEVVRLGNLPAAALSGWRILCPARWSLAGLVFGKSANVLAWRDRPRHSLVDAGLCVLIVLQWFLIGSFPLTRPRRSWQEPGAFITIGTLIAAALATNSFTENLARLPELFVIVAWFWWLGLLVWKVIQFGWRAVMKSRHAPASV